VLVVEPVQEAPKEEITAAHTKSKKHKKAKIESS
jgi:hypothetical protein